MTTVPDAAPPVWLLDVDGVINAVARRPDTDVWPPQAWSARRVTALDGRTWPILTAQPVLDFLCAVHGAGRAEIRWHTTWQRSAVARLGPALDLPEWPVAEAPEFTRFEDSGYDAGTSLDQWWKSGAAERVLGQEGRRLVWTDDDLAAGRSLPAVQRVLAHDSVCLLSPRPDAGLSPADLAVIEQFLDHPTGRQPAVTALTPVVGPIVS